MKKSIFLTLFCFLIGNTLLFSQLTISPNHAVEAACPDVVITYTIGGVPSGCNIVIELFSGDAISFTANNAEKKFTASWTDVPQEVTVRVKPVSGFTCISQTDFKIPVLSVAGTAPTISGCPGSLIIGRSTSFEMEATLKYNFKGSDDDEEVAGYEWQISQGGSGWSLTTLDQNGIIRKKAQVNTDIQNDVIIRVRGISHCGRVSNWMECSITRFVQAPCPIVGAPEFLICENTETFGVLATTVPGVTGYTYHWTYPPTWSGSATGQGAVVTPDGLNGGTIVLVAKAFGLTSASCTAEIDLVPIDPLTSVIGGSFLCDDEQETYALNISPPPSSQVTWSVFPSNVATPASAAFVCSPLTLINLISRMINAGGR